MSDTSRTYTARTARLALPLTAAATLALAACSSPAKPAPGSRKTFQLGVGTDAVSTFQQAFRYYDEKYGVISSIGHKYGYDITPKWAEFPVAPDVFAAMEANSIQIGPAAAFPLINQLSSGKRYHVLTNSLGDYPFLLMVRKGGAIRNSADLRGKTVGLALGTEHQAVFENFIKAEFGQTLQQANIKLASQPAPVPRMPPGLDAYQTFIPAILPALVDPKSEIEPLYSLSDPPATGPAYSGPLGRGAGIALPSMARSPWAPEGFVALRNEFLASDALMKNDPGVVSAFIEAHQTVIKKLQGESVQTITNLYPASTWANMPRQAYEKQSLAIDLIYGKRKGWVWTTSAEVNILAGESQEMVELGVIKSALSVQQLQAAFEPAGKLASKVYSKLGSFPSAAVFTDPKAPDQRGKPVWDIDWATYKPSIHIP